MCARDGVPVGEAAIAPFDMGLAVLPRTGLSVRRAQGTESQTRWQADSRRFREEPAGEMGESVPGQAF
jgi:hypothetical protein